MESGQSQHSEEPHEEVGDCLREAAAFVDMPLHYCISLAILGGEAHAFDVSSLGR